MRYSVALIASLILLASAPSYSDNEPDPGVLDLPLPDSDTPLSIEEQQPDTILRVAGDPEAVQDALREEFANEQAVLQTLPRVELQERADRGERGAQVTLAEDFANEATRLAFAPDAANAALSDAVRFYSLAAQSGFPGAPSLEQAGVQFFPIRVYRSSPN